MVSLNPFKWFKKIKKEKPKFNSYFIIRPNDIAQEEGLDYDFDKVVDVYEGGKKVEDGLPYSPQLVEALETVDEIPGTEEMEDLEDDKFEFDDVTSFGFIEEEK